MIRFGEYFDPINKLNRLSQVTDNEIVPVTVNKKLPMSLSIGNMITLTKGECVVDVILF